MGKSKIMPLEVVELAAEKMVALARQQGVSELDVNFHGGEPMLAGMDWFRQAIGIFTSVGADKVSFKFGMQTNGIMIDDAWAELFDACQISVGISLDGPRHINDRARVNFAGASSYDATVAGIQKMLEHRRSFGGVLCVIDPTVNGLDVYKHFRSLGIPRIDFLWPLDHNWDTPPQSLTSDNATPYADYLIPIFNEWWSNDGQQVRIRYFESIIKGLVGARVGLDSLGAEPINIVAIDTDGSIEPLDSLRAAGNKFTDMGLRIQKDSLSAIYEKELFQMALAGRGGLHKHCQQCVFSDVCGGGYLPHRYSSETGFDNPSVYCRDLWKLINHIAGVVVAELEKPLYANQAAS